MVKLKENAKDDLEKALSSKGNENEQTQMPKEQEIAFHQGALNTLVAERDGLGQMIGIVESRMQAHLKRLEELGVKIEQKK
jgi:hypothetical protein